ncbi:hypothetical protein ACIBF7_03575 [Nonomuraea sp. NPDC050478]|uniref:hypothetical protein n=1 Tax=Nonomuraea sp. NPDC050478 TaxID=3364365 RepID=UPI003791CF4F
MAPNIVHIAAASMAPRRLYRMTFPSILDGERMRTDHQRIDDAPDRGAAQLISVWLTATAVFGCPHIVIGFYIPAIVGIGISGSIMRKAKNDPIKATRLPYKEILDMRWFVCNVWICTGQAANSRIRPAFSEIQRPD